jgi:hypothetical protein
MPTHATRIALLVCLLCAFATVVTADCVGAIGGCPPSAPCTENIDGIEYCSSCCIAYTDAPTLSEWALVTLTILLAFIGMMRLRTTMPPVRR